MGFRVPIRSWISYSFRFRVPDSRFAVFIWRLLAVQVYGWGAFCTPTIIIESKSFLSLPVWVSPEVNYRFPISDAAIRMPRSCVAQVEFWLHKPDIPRPRHLFGEQLFRIVHIWMLFSSDVVWVPRLPFHRDTRNRGSDGIAPPAENLIWNRGLLPNPQSSKLGILGIACFQSFTPNDANHSRRRRPAGKVKPRSSASSAFAGLEILSFFFLWPFHSHYGHPDRHYNSRGYCQSDQTVYYVLFGKCTL